mgnify:CR=1 FL=1
MRTLNDVTPEEWDRAAEGLKTGSDMLATDKQVGGKHYKEQGLEPVEVTYENFGYYGVRAALYTKVNKYLTRNKGNHLQDLEKAKHCIELQIEFAKRGCVGD